MIGKPNIQVTRAVTKTWGSNIFKFIINEKGSSKQQETAELLQMVEHSLNKQSGTPKKNNVRTATLFKALTTIYSESCTNLLSQHNLLSEVPFH
jgi:hypothetical protein